MSTSSIVSPLHFLIVEHKGTTWAFKGGGNIFYNPRNVPVSLKVEDLLHRFGLTPAKVVIALFRLNGGRAGYYLANLRDRQYYYCGTDWEDVRATFQAIGIGRPDPH
jgi:hypothetical protein